MQKKNKLGKKHKLIGVIYEEYLHSVLSWKIPVGILIILIVGIMVHYEKQVNNVMNGFEKLVSSSNFNKLLIFAAALPVSLSFANYMYIRFMDNNDAGTYSIYCIRNDC